MDIQSAILETKILNSSDAHPKLMSKLRSSIASTLSAPAEPESFDTNQVILFSIKSRGTVLDASSYSLKAAHVGVIFLEDLCNHHRREFPVLPYQKFMVNCPYPFFRVIVLVSYCVYIKMYYPQLLINFP